MPVPLSSLLPLPTPSRTMKADKATAIPLPPLSPMAAAITATTTTAAAAAAQLRMAAHTTTINSKAYMAVQLVPPTKAPLALRWIPPSHCLEVAALQSPTTARPRVQMHPTRLRARRFVQLAPCAGPRKPPRYTRVLPLSPASAPSRTVHEGLLKDHSFRSHPSAPLHVLPLLRALLRPQGMLPAETCWLHPDPKSAATRATHQPRAQVAPA